MSGGAWGYLSHELLERADAAREGLRLLAAIEQEMDWGVSGDTCRKCAELRVLAALVVFFERRATDATAAVAVARDGEQNWCPRCEERRAQRKAEGQ